MNMRPEDIDFLCRWVSSAPDAAQEEEVWKKLDKKSKKLLTPLRDVFRSQKDRWKSQQQRLDFLQAILENLPPAVFAKDADGRFAFFNRAYEKMFAVDSENLLGKTVHELEFLPQEDRQRYHTEDTEAIRSTATTHREITFVLDRQSSRPCLYWSRGFRVPTTGQRGLVGSIVDISEQKATEQTLAQKIVELKEAKARIEELNRTDPLTGLFNRRFFEESFTKAVSQAQRHQQPLSLIMLDLDHFKQVNDVYGHDVGDQVLQKFSDILRKTCRNEDTIARVGGEEFLIILHLTKLDSALNAAERIRHEVDATTFSHANCRITASSGVAQLLPKELPEEMLRRVDKALYRAKRHGRNQVTC